MQINDRTGLKECLDDQIFPKDLDTTAETSDKRKAQCCGWDKQPKWGTNDEARVEMKQCAPGCQNSIWNVKNQVCCAAKLLRNARDKSQGNITLQQMICMYRHGIGAEVCKDPDRAAGTSYVKSVQECLDNLANPPKGAVEVPPGSI
jgi:hypothetical protein